MFESGKPAAEIIKAKGFEERRVTPAPRPSSINPAANPEKVAEVKAGNEKAMNWFTGQAMKASQGKATLEISSPTSCGRKCSANAS